MNIFQLQLHDKLAPDLMKRKIKIDTTIIIPNGLLYITFVTPTIHSFQPLLFLAKKKKKKEACTLTLRSIRILKT